MCRIRFIYLVCDTSLSTTKQITCSFKRESRKWKSLKSDDTKRNKFYIQNLVAISKTARGNWKFWDEQNKVILLKGEIITSYHSVNRSIAYEEYILLFFLECLGFFKVTEKTYHWEIVAVTWFLVMKSKIFKNSTLTKT